MSEVKWICKVNRLCERYGRSHIQKESIPSEYACTVTSLCGSPIQSFNFTSHKEPPKGTEACKRCLKILNQS